MKNLWRANFILLMKSIRSTILQSKHLPSRANSKVLCLPLLEDVKSPDSRLDKRMSIDETNRRENEPSTESLRSVVAEQEARLTEIADLVANVRHEINNPLTGVLGQAQLLLREELSESARRRVETIERLATRIRDTVARLRDVQRPHKNSDE